VRRAGGDAIGIQWRDIDDLSLRLDPDELDDLAGEISYNSDDSRVRPTDFHKGTFWRGSERPKEIDR